MKYVKVKWRHRLPEEPVLLYSELDDARYEVRKVEVYLDRRQGYASVSESSGGTRLGEDPLPELPEIASDAQFEPEEISKHEFEEVWNLRESSFRREI